MTTTCMKDSIVGDNWIYEMTQANPAAHVLNDNGQPTGNILSGPVRLMFSDLLVAKPGNKKKPEGPDNPLKFQTTVLFNPWTDFTVMNEKLWEIARTEFAQFVAAGNDPVTGWPYGINPPFLDQGAKAAQYQGYTPGLKYSALTSNFKPPVVDIRMNPIMDEARIYPGVWAILSMNAYASGKTAQKKGPRLGIQSVMIIADDTNCGGGGAANPNEQFRGANVKPPTVTPAAAFGQPAAPPAAPPANPYATATPPAPSAPPVPPAAPPAAPGGFDLSQFG